MLDVRTPIQYVKGVGPKKAESLAEAGIRTVYDLLLNLPFRYEDRSRRLRVADIEAGQAATVEVEIQSLRVKKTRRKNFKVIEVLAKDDTGQLKAVWFNQEFLKDTLVPGRRVRLFGKFERTGFGLVPEVKSAHYELVELEPEAGALAPSRDSFEESMHTGRVVPVYERIGTMSPKVLRRVVHFLVAGMPRDIPELLPESLRTKYELPLRSEALARVHFPAPDDDLEEYNRFRSPAQKRLIFEELFFFFLGLELRRSADERLSKGRSFVVTDAIREIVKKILPFRLTDAQRRVLKTIADDLARERPMRRLVQGDVGSGKTIVGVLASIIVMENGAQVALMVPTELLAEQHYANVARLLEPAGYRVALLSSRLKKAERDVLLDDIQSGKIRMVVGTHALIQESVVFQELGLAIIDEQHRFGVAQRAVLREKGKGGVGLGCDLLVMTATPIPRSLAMTIHGDLDVSLLDELPPGRKPIRTSRRESTELDNVLREMRSTIAKGQQVYFVCPLVEESEKSDLKAAVARYESLSQGPFRKERVALVHGRMAADEREAVMGAFGRGEVDILVATTVIEVGVDVPNATLIVVEHAERFGLSQLHQLRGRVGRGSARSSAILLTHSPLTEDAEKRLQAMVDTNDGFLIAERDLEIRGPGDFFGTRQSGAPLFHIADMVRDRRLLDAAKSEAHVYLASASAESDDPEAKRVLAHVVRLWGERFDLMEAG
jgi:ATP-dependent DNA helicase RecG